MRLSVMVWHPEKEELEAKHAFIHLEDFAPAKTLDRLKQLYKEKGAKAEHTRSKVRVAKLLGGHRAMLVDLTKDFIAELLDILAEAEFSKSDTAYCCVHGCQCPICPTLDDDDDEIWMDIGAPSC